MNEALALLEKYGPKRPPCPEELKGLLKDLSDIYKKTGRKLGRDPLLKEIRSRGHKVTRSVIHTWIVEAGGEPWFTP